MMKYIIKLQRTKFFSGDKTITYIKSYDDNGYIFTDDKNSAHPFTFEEKESFLTRFTFEETVIALVAPKGYRVKYDGKYVKITDNYEYCAECEKEESIFSEAMAFALLKQQPNRIKLEEIK